MFVLTYATSLACLDDVKIYTERHWLWCEREVHHGGIKTEIGASAKAPGASEVVTSIVPVVLPVLNVLYFLLLYEEYQVF